MNLRITIIGIAVICFCNSCTFMTPTVNVPRVPSKFDFSPPSREKIGSANLTIALIRAKFIGNNPEYIIPPFKEMAVNMGNDFEELLTAKGFTIRGPFGTRDEMIYNDKLSSNFALDISIDLNPEFNRKKNFDPGLGSLVPPSYKTSGEVTFGGSLVITASSPQHAEKIWKKNIPLERVSFTYEGTTKWPEPPTLVDELKQDNVVYNALTRELEKFYNQAMELAWRQIELKEMEGVSAEAKKADMDRRKVIKE